MPPTYFMVTIDTEEEWDWSSGWPTERLAVTNTRSLPRFQRLCDQYGIAATYFTNLAVLENAESRQTLLDVAAGRQVEIGMHIHPWNTPPVTTDRIPTNRSTFIHNLASDSIRAKLASVYNAFLRLGMNPTSFRGGRYSSGAPVHEFLQERGFIAECSVLPYTTWPEEGAPDYRHRDLTPVRIPPSRSGQTPLWELPLTLAYSRSEFGFWRRCFEVVERSLLGKLRLIGLAERLGLVRKVWLNFEIGDPYDWTPFLIMLQRLGVPCICFTVHSSSLAAGPGPYTKTKEDEARIFRQIEQVFSVISRLPGFATATASGVARTLEHQYASLGNQSPR
jgi:hypothetical protein